MAYMATVDPHTAVRSKDLSVATAIPPHYLSKVMRRLVLRGLLVSRKGHGGGFTLAKPKSEIRFRDILEAADAAPASGECAFGWGRCEKDHPCPLHQTWSEISDKMHRWAAETTLADVTEIDPTVLMARLARKR